ncbi:hypothetical protein COO60DRAFT_381114 [Scenedesmus sp. NREL 46B-D3]|nr:hypothetical protein COO60DRAFT_381114 [Scenedesmus sp. NREL 46B-D3]
MPMPAKGQQSRHEVCGLAEAIIVTVRWYTMPTLVAQHVAAGLQQHKQPTRDKVAAPQWPCGCVWQGLTSAPHKQGMCRAVTNTKVSFTTRPLAFASCTRKGWCPRSSYPGLGCLLRAHQYNQRRSTVGGASFAYMRSLACRGGVTLLACLPLAAALECCYS